MYVSVDTLSTVRFSVGKRLHFFLDRPFVRLGSHVRFCVFLHYCSPVCSFWSGNGRAFFVCFSLFLAIFVVVCVVVVGICYAFQLLNHPWGLLSSRAADPTCPLEACVRVVTSHCRACRRRRCVVRLLYRTYRYHVYLLCAFWTPSKL